MKRRLLIGLVVALSACAPAHAQDAERIDLARQVLVASRAAARFDAMLPEIMTALRPLVVGNNVKAGQDWDALMPTVTTEFSAMRDEMLNEITLIYAKTFETSDLRQYIAFYKSPAGQKLTSAMPDISRQSMMIGQRAGQQIAGKLAERMKDELRKRGNKL